MSCITGYWNQEDRMGIYSCPQCRKTFTPRPDLDKNVMIAETNEDWTSRCGSCWSCRREVWRLYWTVKSCLVCLNSSFILMNDTVIDATRRLKQKHEKVLEVFCRTDKHCICVLCVMDEHRNHETVSAAEEMTKMQVWSDIWYYTYFRSPVQSRIDAFL